MVNEVVINSVKYPLDKIILAKGRGASTVIDKEKFIITKDTVETDKSDIVIVMPFDDKFTVLVKPLGELKQKQPTSIMSKFILKSLRSVEVKPTPNLDSMAEFNAKWRVSPPRRR